MPCRVRSPSSSVHTRQADLANWVRAFGFVLAIHPIPSIFHPSRAAHRRFAVTRVCSASVRRTSCLTLYSIASVSLPASAAVGPGLLCPACLTDSLSHFLPCLMLCDRLAPHPVQSMAIIASCSPRRLPQPTDPPAACLTHPFSADDFHSRLDTTFNLLIRPSDWIPLPQGSVARLSGLFFPLPSPSLLLYVSPFFISRYCRPGSRTTAHTHFSHSHAHTQPGLGPGLTGGQVTETAHGLRLVARWRRLFVARPRR